VSLLLLGFPFPEAVAIISPSVLSEGVEIKDPRPFEMELDTSRDGPGRIPEPQFNPGRCEVKDYQRHRVG
jgi:hypothetical protein